VKIKQDFVFGGTRDGKEMFGLDGHALLTAHPSHRESRTTHTAVKTSFFLNNTHATSIFLFLRRRTVSVYRSRKKKKELLSAVGCCRFQAIALVDYFIALRLFSPTTPAWPAA
jgi:hypothetical protein